MDKFIIEGSVALNGEVTPSGNKKRRSSDPFLPVF